MVNIDTVYQKVLALANKEQRGYVTPQEFNLFADKAQKEILEQYFYDINQFGRAPGNDTEYSDALNILEEKVSIFETSAVVTNGVTLPLDLYRLGAVIFNSNEVEQIEHKRFLYVMSSPLTQPTDTMPIYTRTGNTISVTGSNQITNGVTCNYIRQPLSPNWTYVVVNDKALFNAGATDMQNFELHPSEESELVYRILAYAGIAIEKPTLTQVAAGLEAGKVQQEKQ